MIDWVEHPLPPDAIVQIKQYFSELDIELTIVCEQLDSDSFKGEFNCYLCSRNRKRILFDYAGQHSINLIARAPSRRLGGDFLDQSHDPGEFFDHATSPGIFSGQAPPHPAYD